MQVFILTARPKVDDLPESKPRRMPRGWSSPTQKAVEASKLFSRLCLPQYRPLAWLLEGGPPAASPIGEFP